MMKFNKLYLQISLNGQKKTYLPYVHIHRFCEYLLWGYRIIVKL